MLTKVDYQKLDLQYLRKDDYETRSEKMRSDFFDLVSNVMSEIKSMREEMTVMFYHIHEIREEIDEMKRDIAEMKQDISVLKADMVVVKKDISDIKMIA